MLFENNHFCRRATKQKHKIVKPFTKMQIYILYSRAMNATERIKLDKSDYFQLAIISLTCLSILSVPLEPEKNNQ